MNTTNTSRTKGFTLLEVLVALVVLSIGLLGLSGLQTTGLRNNYSALQRSQATILSHDVLDRMRANAAAARDGNYNLGYTTTPSSVICSASCSPAQIAQLDLVEWRDYVERLPGGEGEISVTAAGVAQVAVRWADARDSSNKLEVITRAQL